MTHGADIQIRPLARSDEAEWRRLWTDYLSFYNTKVADEVYATYFERLLGDDSRDFSGLIARVDGVARGLAHFLVHRHGWRINETCYLQDLFVDPEVRGTGLGRALIESVYAAADARGVATVYWLTAENNYTARQLYDRLASKSQFVQYVSSRK